MECILLIPKMVPTTFYIRTLSLRFCVNNFAVHVQMFTQLIMKIIPDLHIYRRLWRRHHTHALNRWYFFSVPSFIVRVHTKGLFAFERQNISIDKCSRSHFTPNSIFAYIQYMLYAYTFFNVHFDINECLLLWCVSN